MKPTEAPAFYIFNDGPLDAQAAFEDGTIHELAKNPMQAEVFPRAPSGMRFKNTGSKDVTIRVLLKRMSPELERKYYPERYRR